MSKAPGEILKRPLITEKGTMLGEEANVVLFQVALDANKIEVRHAVESLYDVKVISVRTQVVMGKVKTMGRYRGRRAKWKKAIVRLAEGASIDFFSVA